MQFAYKLCWSFADRGSGTIGNYCKASFEGDLDLDSVKQLLNNS